MQVIELPQGCQFRCFNCNHAVYEVEQIPHTYPWIKVKYWYFVRCGCTDGVTWPFQFYSNKEFDAKEFREKLLRWYYVR